MQLRRISALEREKVENEFRQLQETIARLERAAGRSQRKILAEVREETEELKKKLRGARRTQIRGPVQEFRREELEAHEQVAVTLSQGGYIKQILASTYRSQHRGGKGVLSMNTREDDPVRHILGRRHARHPAFLYRSWERYLGLTSYELRADTSRNTRGVPVANVVALKDTETVSFNSRRPGPRGGGPLPRADDSERESETRGPRRVREHKPEPASIR